MAENIPPNPSANNTASGASSAPSAAPATTTVDQPGRPYYESLRTTLRSTLEKKRKLDEQLAQLEENIFKAEGSYLEETAASGNIVRGFDGWVKGVSVSGGGAGGRHAAAEERRRGRVREEDRVFSRSSVSWMKAQEGPESTSSSHAPTPTSSFAPQLGSAVGTPAASGGASGIKSAGTNKKKRPQEKEEEEEGKGNKRGKITYSREA